MSVRTRVNSPEYIRMLQDGSMFKSQSQFSPYLYLHVKVSLSRHNTSVCTLSIACFQATILQKARCCLDSDMQHTEAVNMCKCNLLCHAFTKPVKASMPFTG